MGKENGQPQYDPNVTEGITITSEIRDKLVKSTALIYLQKLCSTNISQVEARILSAQAYQITTAWDAAANIGKRVSALTVSGITPLIQERVLPLVVLNAGCYLFAEDRVNEIVALSKKDDDTAIQAARETLINSPMRDMLSNRFDSVSFSGFLSDDFTETDKINPNLGNYYDLFMDLILTNYDQEKFLPKLVEISEDKGTQVSRANLQHLILSAGSFAFALATTHDLTPASENLSGDRTANRAIRQKGSELLTQAANFQSKILTVLYNPQRGEFPALKEAMQPYLSDKNVQVQKLALILTTRNSPQQIGNLYRIAEYYFTDGIEREFYQQVMAAIENVSNTDNQGFEGTDFLTDQEIPIILAEDKKAPEFPTTAEEIIQTAETIKKQSGKKAFECSPKGIEGLGLHIPDSINLQFSGEETEARFRFVWQYKTASGRSLELIMQFNSGQKDDKSRNLTWNFLPSPTNPQLKPELKLLRDILLKAAGQILADLKNQHQEKARQPEGQQTTTLPPTPQIESSQKPKITIPGRETKVERILITMEMNREVRRVLSRLSNSEQQMMRETVQKYNEQGGNLMRLQLGGVRGGPYYYIGIGGGKMIVLEKVGSTSALSVVTVGTFAEVSRILTRR